MPGPVAFNSKFWRARAAARKPGTGVDSRLGGLFEPEHDPVLEESASKPDHGGYAFQHCTEAQGG
jgi:hypothetical protein